MLPVPATASFDRGTVPSKRLGKAESRGWLGSRLWVDLQAQGGQELLGGQPTLLLELPEQPLPFFRRRQLRKDLISQVRRQARSFEPPFERLDKILVCGRLLRNPVSGLSVLHLWLAIAGN